MPPALQLAEGFYEEDCDWSLVYIAFEDEFCKTRKDYGPDFIQLVRDTAKCWHPDRMSKHTGKKVAPNESPILRTRAAYQHALGDYCTTTAWGDWADWVIPAWRWIMRSSPYLTTEAMRVRGRR